MEERLRDPFIGTQYVKPYKQERLPMEFGGADIAFAFGMLICGFLFWNLINGYSLGAGVTVFTIVICAATLMYMNKSGIVQNGKSLACLAMLALTAAQFVIFDNIVIKTFGFLFLMMLYVYWVCVSTGRQIDTKLSIYLIGDAIKQGIVMPFSNFACCACGIKQSVGRHKSGKAVLSFVAGIVIALPILAAVIQLLISADLAFEGFANSIGDMFQADRAFLHTLQFAFGIPVAFYLYGLVYGDVKGRYADGFDREAMDKLASGIRFAPRLTIYSALSAFNLVYVIFFAVQAAYFFSAFQGSLPETFTYAEYARRGFFELCAVAGINLGILSVAFVTMKRSAGEAPKGLRVQAAVISSFTMLLIVTAFSKMFMYIESYGLTQLRVFTSWFMLLLFFIFTVVLIRQIARFNASRVIVIGFAVLFMSLSYGNVDGAIAKYNIERYKSGTLPGLDCSAMMPLSAGAIPHVHAFYLELDGSDSKDRALKEDLEKILKPQSSYWQTDGRSDFRDFNWQRHQADKLSLTSYPQSTLQTPTGSSSV